MVDENGKEELGVRRYQRTGAGIMIGSTKIIVGGQGTFYVVNETKCDKERLG